MSLYIIASLCYKFEGLLHVGNTVLLQASYVYSKNNFEKKFNKKSQYDLGTTVLSNYCSSVSFTTDLFPNSQSEDL